MQLSPSPHYVSFAQAIFSAWPDFAMIGIIGAACFFVALWRFKKVMKPAG